MFLTKKLPGSTCPLERTNVPWQENAFAETFTSIVDALLKSSTFTLEFFMSIESTKSIHDIHDYI